MDALAYIQSDISALSSTFEVWEKADGSGLYDDGWSSTMTTADVHVFNPSSQQQVVVEGSGEQTTYTGLKTVTCDSNDDIVHDVEVNQQLRRNGKHYDVRVKDGLPNEHDPDVWRLGLDAANSSN